MMIIAGTIRKVENISAKYSISRMLRLWPGDLNARMQQVDAWLIERKYATSSTRVPLNSVVHAI